MTYHKPTLDACAAFIERVYHADSRHLKTKVGDERHNAQEIADELRRSLPAAPEDDAPSIPPGYKLVPVDDEKRDHANSALPEDMISAGCDALEKCQRDLNNYKSGETPDWDNWIMLIRLTHTVAKTH